MANNTDADFNAFLKVLYPDGKIPDLTYTKRPLFDLIPKNTKMGGLRKDQPVLTRPAKLASHTAATAFDATNTQQVYAAFQLDVANDYQNVYIPRKDYYAAKSAGRMGSFGDLVKESVEQGKEAMKNRIARQIYGTGLGAIGQISAVSGATFTLSRTRDHRHIHDGDVLVFDTTDGSSGTVHAGTATVTAVNRSTGVVTCGSTFMTASITGIAADDYVFQSGDFGGGFYGLGSWLAAGTAAESFYGLDRTAQDHTQGIRYTVTGNRVDGLIDAIDALYDQSDSVPTWIFVNPLEYAVLAKELQSTVVHNAVQGRGQVGFSALTLHTNLGEVPILADPWCHSNEGYALNKDFICLESMGELIHRQMEQPVIAAASADAFQIRLSSYPVLNVGKGPSKHLKITFA